MLIGKKVVLEEIDRDNIEWMRKQRNDPEMRKFFREWKDISIDQQEIWYKTRGNNSDPNHVYFQIMEVPEHKDDYIGRSKAIDERKIIGCCGLHYIDWRLRSAEFGIFISQGARGKGLGKEALTMLCDYGFKEVGLHKIWAETYSFNKALGLYASLGFKKDGVLRDNCFYDGKYWDSIILSVLQDEWKPEKEK